jgi:hypothetical protein
MSVLINMMDRLALFNARCPGPLYHLDSYTQNHFDLLSSEHVLVVAIKCMEYYVRRA